MISVAMTTYNGGKYLKEQLDSICNQTIQDIEIVICDDCSLDNTWEILSEYEIKDSRIKIFKNESNLGFKRNFENAIRRCSGDFIALSDQDDIWMPNHLEVLLSEMKEDTQIVCGTSVLIDENGEDMGQTCANLYGLDSVPTDNLDFVRHIIMHKNSFLGNAMLIRESFFANAIPIPDGVVYHDSWFSFLASMINGMKYINVPILKYRRHNDEITALSKRKSALREFIGKVMFNHSGFDVLEHIQAIKKCNLNICIEYKTELLKLEKMIKRRRTLIGRLLNVPYILKHYKAIFTCERVLFF